MKVILRAELFSSSPVYDVTLVEFLTYAFDGRYRVALKDPTASDMEGWLKLQCDKLEAELRLGLEISDQEEALNPSPSSVEVGANCDDDWNANPPILTVETARRFLRLPARVLLENNLNDKAFVFAVAKDEVAKMLQEWEAEGWLTFDMAGGINGMPARIGILDGDPLQQRKTMVIFDSDALLPGFPSSDSANVAALCQQKSLEYHQLNRRYIESYVPVKAVFERVKHTSNAGARKDLRNRAQAYSRMPRDEQRHHFNIKKGFHADSGRADYSPSVDAFFGNVNQIDKNSLDHGLDKDLAKAFSDKVHKIDYGWMVRDGSTGETAQIVDKLRSVL